MLMEWMQMSPFYQWRPDFWEQENLFPQGSRDGQHQLQGSVGVLEGVLGCQSGAGLLAPVAMNIWCDLEVWCVFSGLLSFLFGREIWMRFSELQLNVWYV